MHRIKLSFLVGWMLATSLPIAAQIGGRYTYEFLGNPASARLSALGGSLITIADSDITLATANPALLSDTSHNQVTVNHNFAFAGGSNGHLGYARKIDNLGINAHIGVSYASFGEFTAADELGNDLGTFTGGETAVIIGASKRLNERITLGLNVKSVFGNLENYSSFGLGADIGLLYTKPGSNFSAAVVFKNIGSELSAYGDEAASFPLDIQIGISQKLQHLPFRFSIIAHQLQQWGIRYDDPDRVETESLFGEPVAEPSAFNNELDNFFRHFIFNGEFLLGKTQGFKLRFGYNHLRRKELSLSNFRSLAGFSGGFGMRIKGIDIDYGFGYFHLAGASNHLSVRTNLDRFFRTF